MCFRATFTAILALLLTSCAGSQPDLVELVWETDQVADCQQITAEMRANNQRITDLAREEGLKVTQNVAVRDIVKRAKETSYDRGF